MSTVHMHDHYKWNDRLSIASSINNETAISDEIMHENEIKINLLQNEKCDIGDSVTGPSEWVKHRQVENISESL